MAGLTHHVVEWEGRRLGLLGLVEVEWLDTLATINQDQVQHHVTLSRYLVTLSCHVILSLTLSIVTSVQVQYEDYVTAANTLSAKLREEEGCEVDSTTLILISILSGRCVCW